jgi:hypothetical protein
MVLVKTYQRSKLFLVLLDERPHEKSWGFLFLPSGCNLTPSPVRRSCHVVSHEMFPMYPKYQEKMFPLYPKFPLFLIIPTYCFAQTHATQIPGWDDRWITDCWSVIHAKQYKILWTGGSQDKNYYKKKYKLICFIHLCFVPL